MSDSKQYEEIRRTLKNEQKHPNPYTKNRKQALMERTLKFHGEGALKEITKEFKLI